MVSNTFVGTPCPSSKSSVKSSSSSRRGGVCQTESKCRAEQEGCQGELADVWRFETGAWRGWGRLGLGARRWHTCPRTCLRWRRLGCRTERCCGSIRSRMFLVVFRSMIRVQRGRAVETMTTLLRCESIWLFLRDTVLTVVTDRLATNRIGSGPSGAANAPVKAKPESLGVQLEHSNEIMVLFMPSDAKAHINLWVMACTWWWWSITAISGYPIVKLVRRGHSVADSTHVRTRPELVLLPINSFPQIQDWSNHPHNALGKTDPVRFPSLISVDALHFRIIETTKLTQELAVKLEQGRDLCQCHSMADWEVSGKTLCGKSEDWEISKWTRLEGNQSSALGLYILSRGLHVCTLDLQISYATVHEETMRSIAWISGSYPTGRRRVMRSTWDEHEVKIGVIEQRWNIWGT